MKSRQNQNEHESQNGFDSSEDERPHGGRKRGRNSGGSNGSSGGNGSSSGGSERSKQKLYCICKKPDDGQPMFQCDGCKEWFHPKCLGYSELDMNKMKSKKTYCLKCGASAESKEPPRKRSSSEGASEQSEKSSHVSSSSATTADASTETKTVDTTENVSSSSTTTTSASASTTAAATAAATTTTSSSSGVEPSKKKTKTYVWNGSLKCEGLGSFNLSAQYVCGTSDMVQSMPSCMNLQKRVALDKLLDYLHKCSIYSSRKRCVLRLEASGSDSDLQAYNSLHKYFLNRNKAGFVDVEGTSRDGYEMMYLLPLQCNATSLPAFISQDSNATMNKRVVTSGAQKPRFLLILVGESNSAAAPSTGEAEPDKPSTEVDSSIKQEPKTSSSSSTTTTTATDTTTTASASTTADTTMS